MGSRLKQIYKITYPNGMIYIGSDLRGDEHYCGSPTGARQKIADDLGIALVDVPRYPLAHERRITRDGACIHIELPHLGLILRKEILWESKTAGDTQVRQMEFKFIRKMGANNPAIGYNRVPRYSVVGV